MVQTGQNLFHSFEPEQISQLTLQMIKGCEQNLPLENLALNVSTYTIYKHEWMYSFYNIYSPDFYREQTYSLTLGKLWQSTNAHLTAL